MKRRELTAEEKGEAESLAAAWSRYRAENKGATQAWLAAESGLGTQGAVSQYLRGVIPLNVEALVAVCRVIQVDPKSISPRLMKMVETPGSLAGAMAAFEGRFLGLDVADDEDPRLVQIPKVKLRLSAGISGFEVEPERFDGSTYTVTRSWIERHGYSRDKLLALLVRGESMETTLYDGDLVVINTAERTPIDGEVYAVNYEGEPVIKRLSRDAGRWWLTSDNKDQHRYYRKVCEGDSCIIVGKVVKRESDRL